MDEVQFKAMVEELKTEEERALQERIQLNKLRCGADKSTAGSVQEAVEQALKNRATWILGGGDVIFFVSKIASYEAAQSADPFLVDRCGMIGNVSVYCDHLYPNDELLSGAVDVFGKHSRLLRFKISDPALKPSNLQRIDVSVH